MPVSENGAKIKIKRNLVSASKPTALQLEQGELAINVADGILFVKKVAEGSEVVVEFLPTALHPPVTVDKTSGLTIDNQEIGLDFASRDQNGALRMEDYDAFSDKVSSQFETVTGGVNLPSGNIGIGVVAPVAKISLPASTSAAGGIDMGGDVSLYRSAADTLKTDDNFLCEKLAVSGLNDAPASSGALGGIGEIRITADYIYVCTGVNAWKRAALSTW